MELYLVKKLNAIHNVIMDGGNYVVPGQYEFARVGEDFSITYAEHHELTKLKMTNSGDNTHVNIFDTKSNGHTAIGRINYHPEDILSFLYVFMSDEHYENMVKLLKEEHEQMTQSLLTPPEPNPMDRRRMECRPAPNHKGEMTIKVKFNPALKGEEILNELMAGSDKVISEVGIDMGLGAVYVPFSIRHNLHKEVVKAVMDSFHQTEVTKVPEPKELRVPRVVSSVKDILLHEYDFFDLDNVRKFDQKHPEVAGVMEGPLMGYSYLFFKALAEYTNTTVQYWINIHNNHLKSIGREEVVYQEVFFDRISQNVKFSDIARDRFNKSNMSVYALSLAFGLTESHTKQLLNGEANWEDILNKFDALYKAFGSSPEYWANVYKNCGDKPQE